MSRDWGLIRHFLPDEWGSRASRARVAWELIETLDDVRGMAGVPVNIFEAWAESGHAADSYHYVGLAVDFYFSARSDGFRLSPLEQLVLLSGFFQIGGLGWYPTWHAPGWHVDLRKRETRLVWACVDGKYLYGWREMSRALVFFEGVRW